MRHWLWLVMATWVIARPVHAAVVSPSSADLQLDAGSQNSLVWEVTNDSGATAQYDMELQQVTFGQLADDLHFAALSAEERSWFQLEPTQAVLQPEEKARVTLTVTAPVDVSNQEIAVAMIVVEDQEGDEAGIGLQEATAAITFVSVGGAPAPQVRIDDFQAFPGDEENQPIRFVTALTNTGNGVAQPQMQVVVKNIFGQTVEVLNGNETGRRLPADTTRAYVVEWPKPHFAFGRYTAELVVLPEDGAELIGRRASVVLFTWQSVALLTAILFSCGLGGWYAFRHLKR